MSAALDAKPSLTIKRRLNATPARVYSAWTDPEKMMRWWKPTDAGRTVIAEADVRVGGSFHIVMHTPTGDKHDISGVYQEVIPNEKLVFSWSWRSTPERQSLVTLTFKPDSDGTLLTLMHEHFFDEAARDNHKRGWDPILDQLAKFLA
jgi:uncharacterized protein YndB with AHSA1/START domain